MSEHDDKQSSPPSGAPTADDGAREVLERSYDELQQRIDGQPQQQLPPVNASLQMQQAFNLHCQAILETVIWGTIAKFSALGASVVGIAFCRAFGTMVGTMFQGSLADVLTFRRQCREAFLDALQKSPPPSQQPAPLPGQHPGQGRRVNGS